MVKNSKKSDYFVNHYFVDYDLGDYLIDLLDEGLKPKEIEETIKVGRIELKDKWREELITIYNKHYKSENSST
tara:strand:- start:1717 stop:1935 length:219 start_codon:yes stop_codon:yes gene_type:complete